MWGDDMDMDMDMGNGEGRDLPCKVYIFWRGELVGKIDHTE